MSPSIYLLPSAASIFVKRLVSACFVLADPHVWVGAVARRQSYGHVGATRAKLGHRVQALVVKFVHLAVEVADGIIV